MRTLVRVTGGLFAVLILAFVALLVGARYERQLVRIEEGPQVAPLLSQLGRKYLGGSEVPLEAVTSGYLWLFELAPRS